MKRQRPSLDTSFSSLSLVNSAAAPASSSDVQRLRTDSAASHSSSSVAFATPPDGQSPHRYPTTIHNAVADSHIPTGELAIPASNTAMHKAQEVLEYVKTKYDYTAENPEGLSFYAGQFIQVLSKTESGWWNGRLADKQGWFPYTYAHTESPTFVPVYAQVSFLHSAPSAPRGTPLLSVLFSFFPVWIRDGSGSS